MIHIENQWQENLRTVEGAILHEKAHDTYFPEKRGDVIISRGMPVFSGSLGVNGVCDIVELRKSVEGVKIFGRDGLYLPVPVEYKKGKPKEHDADILQLCAQAMCLEEMLLCEIKEGFLFYGETKHRQKVCFDEQLREKVKSMFDEMHQYYDRKYTPKVKPSKSCRACSLADLCMPRICKNLSVTDYIKSNISEVGECESC